MIGTVDGGRAHSTAHTGAVYVHRGESWLVTDLDLEFVTSMQRTRHELAIDERIDFFFTARSWSGEPRIIEAAKAADLRWFALDELPDPVVSHERVVLEALRDGTIEPYTTFGF